MGVLLVGVFIFLSRSDLVSWFVCWLFMWDWVCVVWNWLMVGSGYLLLFEVDGKLVGD